MHRLSTAARTVAALSLVLAMVAGVIGLNSPGKAAAQELVEADVCLSLFNETGLLDADGNVILTPDEFTTAVSDDTGTILSADIAVLVLAGGCVGQIAADPMDPVDPVTPALFLMTDPVTATVPAAGDVVTVNLSASSDVAQASYAFYVVDCVTGVATDADLIAVGDAIDADVMVTATASVGVGSTCFLFQTSDGVTLSNSSVMLVTVDLDEAPVDPVLTLDLCLSLSTLLDDDGLVVDADAFALAAVALNPELTPAQITAVLGGGCDEFIDPADDDPELTLSADPNPATVPAGETGTVTLTGSSDTDQDYYAFYVADCTTGMAITPAVSEGGPIAAGVPVTATVSDLAVGQTCFVFQTANEGADAFASDIVTVTVTEDAPDDPVLTADLCLSLSALLDDDGLVLDDTLFVDAALLLNPDLADAQITAVLGGGCDEFIDPDDASPSPIGSDNGGGSASASASASPSASPSFEGDVVEDAVTITGAFQEDADRAGEYEYFYNFVAADETNDIRLAGEGEQEYFVAFFDEDNDLVNVDSGSTDANGMVTLDAPADEDYFIYEADDLNDPFGSQSQPAGAESSFFVVEYEADITASPSASASAPASAPASAEPSARGSDNPSGGPTASNDGTDSNGGASNGGAQTPNGGSTAKGGSTSGTGSGTAMTLPNTGAGSSDMGGSMTWALVALLAIAGVAAAGFGLRRRNV